MRGPEVLPESADIIVTRDTPDAIPEGVALNGVLQATGGDFDGDGWRDLAVGEPSRVLTTGAGTIPIRMTTEQQSFSCTCPERDTFDHDAGRCIRGDFELIALGVLAKTPAVDLIKTGSMTGHRSA
jgi:hypothetical protein